MELTVRVICIVYIIPLDNITNVRNNNSREIGMNFDFSLVNWGLFFYAWIIRDL